MANAEKIRETLTVARVNQHRLKMSAWADGCVNPNAANWQECSVSFCLAGWRAVLDGLRPQADAGGSATGRFIDSDNRVWQADDWADQSMELTRSQSHQLFVETQHVTNIDALDWAAEQIIAGNGISECEACGGDGVDFYNAAYRSCEGCEGRGIVGER